MVQWETVYFQQKLYPVLYSASTLLYYGAVGSVHFQEQFHPVIYSASILQNYGSMGKGTFPGKVPFSVLLGKYSTELWFSGKKYIGRKSSIQYSTRQAFY